MRQRFAVIVALSFLMPVGLSEAQQLEASEYDRPFDAVMVRVSPDGKRYGRNELDPLPWKNSKFLRMVRRISSLSMHHKHSQISLLTSSKQIQISNVL